MRAVSVRESNPQRKGIMKKVFLPMMVAAAVMSAAGCKDDNSAERAGRDLDRAAEKTKDKLEKAADKTGDAVKDAADKIKDATK